MPQEADRRKRDSSKPVWPAVKAHHCDLLSIALLSKTE